MRFLPVRRVCPALLLLASLAAPAAAQTADGAPRSLTTLRAGLSMAGTGDAANCTLAPSLALGIERRTAGRAFVALSGDLHLGLPIACSDVGTLVPYGEGRFAHEDGGGFFALAPRVGLRAGTETALGNARLEPSLGGGMVLSTDLDGEETGLQPWASAALGVQLPRSRWGMHLELGTHRVTMRHEIYDDTRWEETRSFGRWEPLVQISVRRGL